MQDIYDFLRCVVVDEDTDRIMACSQGGGLFCQTGFQVGDLAVVCTGSFFFFQFGEEEAVVVFCVKEGDLQDGLSFFFDAVVA